MATNRRLRPPRVRNASTALLGVVLSVVAIAFVGVSCSTSSGPRDQNWGSDIGRSDGSTNTGGQGGGSSGGSDGTGGSAGNGASGGDEGATGGLGAAGNSVASSGGGAGATGASGGAGGGT